MRWWEYGVSLYILLVDVGGNLDDLYTSRGRGNILVLVESDTTDSCLVG